MQPVKYVYTTNVRSYGALPTCILHNLMFASKRVSKYFKQASKDLIKHSSMSYFVLLQCGVFVGATVLLSQQVWLASNSQAFQECVKTSVVAPTVVGLVSTLKNVVFSGFGVLLGSSLVVERAATPELFEAVTAFLNDPGLLGETKSKCNIPNIPKEHNRVTCFKNGQSMKLKAPEPTSRFVWFRGALVRIVTKVDPTTKTSDGEIKLWSWRGRTHVLTRLVDECSQAAKLASTSCVYRVARSTTTEWQKASLLDLKCDLYCYKTDDDTDIMKELEDDVNNFRHGEARNAQLGIAHRRGYLLHGPPGTGKTTMIMILAFRLKMNLCVMDLNESNLTDAILRDRVANAPENSIILLEDVDCAVSVNTSASTTSNASYMTTGNKLTLSGILSLLDGQLGVRSGRIFVLTTNHVELLPRALIRPGRCDFARKIDLASTAQLVFVFKSFSLTLRTTT